MNLAVLHAMQKTSFSRTQSTSSNTELLPLGTDGEYEHPSSHSYVVGLGTPEAKPLVDWVDGLVVGVSLLCYVVSVCTITPRLWLSWRLGFNGQIVVIGLLLGVMNLCLKRIAPRLFLHIEARWGDSVLQNYDAIMRNTSTLSHTSVIWRATIVLLTILPLGLGAAYKRFTGGYSTTLLYTPGSPNPVRGHYGLSPLPMGSLSTLSNSIFLAINASAQFVAASSNDSMPLVTSDLPLAYGFNTLLLDNYSAALLDVPAPAYVTSIQEFLLSGESWNLTAEVNATVARMDRTFVNQEDNDPFWASTWTQATGFGYLSSAELYQDNFTDLGLMVAPDYTATSGPYCVLGFYEHGYTNGIGQWLNDSVDAQLFRNSSPWKFDIRRELCAGTWQISKQKMNLIHGSCTGLPVSQLIFGTSIPFWADSLPTMVQTIGPFSPTGIRNASTWKLPAIVTSIATMYWSRMIYMNGYPSATNWKPFLDTYYPATNETIESTRATLRASWLLYLVLTVQPLMTVSFLVATMFLWNTPVAKGFGLIAILAGLDRPSMDCLKGAALSGELKRPTAVRIVTKEGQTMVPDTGEVKYFIDERENWPRARLVKGKKYA